MSASGQTPAGSLVSLEHAVSMIQREVYGLAPNYGERADGLAHAVISLVPVYRLSDEAQAQPVPAAALTDGMPRKGGREIRYIDGRPPLSNLFISRTSMDSVIQLLKGAPSSDFPQAEGRLDERDRANRIPPPE